MLTFLRNFDPFMNGSIEADEEVRVCVERVIERIEAHCSVTYRIRIQLV